MSSKCNIILKEERNPKKEIVLYRHSDGHPSIMIDMLSKILYDTYVEFEKHGDVDWFLEPTNVAGKIIINSVHKLPEELLGFLDKLDYTTQKKFSMYSNIDLPTILPETHRVPNCNYEYIITLKELVDSMVFRGYNLEVIKLSNNRKVQDILSLDVNLNAADKVGVIDEKFNN